MKMRSKELEEIKTFFKQNKDAWKETIGGKSTSRFLGRFRSDLMRLAPEGMPEYLNDETSGLNGGVGTENEEGKPKKGSDFGKKICEKFFNDSSPNIDKWNKYRNALVYACMEMEATLNLNESEKDKKFKETLIKRLSLWEVH